MESLSAIDTQALLYTYTRNALAHDSLAKAVRALVAKKAFAGDMEDLLNFVGAATGIKSTKKLSDEFRRLMPALRTVDIHVVFEQRKAEYRGFRIEQK